MNLQEEAKAIRARHKNLIEVWRIWLTDPILLLDPPTWKDYLAVEFLLPVDPYIHVFKCLTADQTSDLYGNPNRYEMIYWSDLWERLEDPEVYYGEDPFKLAPGVLEKFQEEVMSLCSKGCYYDW